jgi:hypothetical protein
MRVLPVAIACFVIIALRDPDALLKPALPLEDAEIFSYYHAARGVLAIFRFEAGYLHLLDELSGYLIAFFPIRWRPHLMAGLPMAASAVGFALFSAASFRRFVENDAQRAVVCLGLAALPLGNFAKVGVMDYLLWPLLVVVVMVMLAEPRLSLRTGRGVALVATISMVCWTNPVCCALVPLFLYEAWRRRQSDPSSALGHLVLVAACCLYAVFGREPGTGIIKGFEAVAEAAQLIIERVVFEASFGTAARMSFIQAGQWWVLHGVAAAVAVLVVLALWPRLRDSADFRRLSAKIVFIIVSLSVLMPLLRNVWLESVWGRRYGYVQSILMALLILIAISYTVQRLHHLRRSLAALAVVMMGGWLAALNVHNNHLYRTQMFGGDELRLLLRRAAEAQRANRTETFRIDRPRWPVEIHIQAR